MLEDAVAAFLPHNLPAVVLKPLQLACRSASIWSSQTTIRFQLVNGGDVI